MLKPMQDFVLVEIPGDNSGIVIPEGKQLHQKAVVLDIGAGVMTDKGQVSPIPELEVGQTVVLQKYALADGTFDMDGKKVALVRGGDIMAIEEK